MLNKICFLFLFVINFVSVEGQKRQKVTYESNPKLTLNFPASYKKESAIIIFDKEKTQYQLNYENTMTLKKIFSKRVHINDEKGIELYNKLKIPYNDKTSNILVIKARTITPKGKVLELNSDKIQEMTSEDGYPTKVIAFEGVEIGSEIEYYIEWKFSAEYFGSAYFQNDFPSLSNYFELETPYSLDFDLNTYNGIDVYEDTSMNNVSKKIYFTSLENVEPIDDQPYSHPLLYIPRIEYVVRSTSFSKIKYMFSWEQLADLVSERYYKIDKNEMRSITKILKNLDLDKYKNEKEKIASIEKYVKTNFTIKNDGEKSSSDINEAVKNKFTSKDGLLHLYSSLFSVAKIPYELGYTTNRLSKKFDYSWENWENLSYELFYFPNQKVFISPLEVEYRMPEIPNYAQGNNSIFIKASEDKNSRNQSLIAKPIERKIPISNGEENYHNMNINVDFNSDMSGCLLKTEISFLGAAAVGIRPLFDFLEEKKKEEIAKSLLQFSEADNEISNIKWQNQDLKNITLNKPFLLSGEIESKSSIEKASKKYLFKIGELIGKQSEMYKDEDRRFDIDLDMENDQDRVITVNIPDGYKINNLDDLKISKILNVNGKDICEFNSNYTLIGNKLVVTLKEYYHALHISKEYINGFRDVINAAADFNKIILVIEKK